MERSSKLDEVALKRAIAQSDGQKLRQAAEALLDEAAAGKPWAVAMLADRLDGKASQEVTVKRELSEMSLAELAAEVAAARGGDSAALDGAAEPTGLH